MLPFPIVYLLAGQPPEEVEITLRERTRTSEEWLILGSGRRSCAPSCRITAKAVLASLAAVLFLISMCSYAQSRIGHSSLTKRRLSEDKGDLSRDSGVCGGTQKDTGSPPSEEEYRASALLEVSEPRAKRPKLLLRKEEAEGGAAGPSGVSSPPEGRRKTLFRRQKPGVQQGRLQQPVPSSLTEGVETAHHLPDPPGSLKPSTQQLTTTGSDENSGVVSGDGSAATAPGGRTSREMLAATALILLREPRGIAGGSDTETVHQGEEEPQPSTSAAGMEGTHLKGVEKSGVQPVPCPGPAPQVDLQRFVVAPVPAGEEEDPAVPDFYPFGLVPPVNHPFSRLPSLNPGVVPKKFDTVRALFSGIAYSQPGRLLVEIRELLAKVSLSQREADMLIEKAERLAAHCHHRQKAQTSPTDARRAADVLATRFLILDAIVSALLVTRQATPAAWWRDFVTGIPHEVFLQSPVRLVYFQSRNKLLARALSRGVAALKKGIRPNHSDLFKYKFMIFCSSRHSEIFNRPLYNPWRSDCSGLAGAGQGSPYTG